MTRTFLVETNDRISWITVDTETGRWLSVVDVPRPARILNGAARV